MTTMTTTTTTTKTSEPTTVTTWTIDPAHTTVGFRVRHLMITNVHGEFQKVCGTVRYDPHHPAATAVDAEIPVASISTREPQRDAHLRSPDFFDAERHPTITFRSKGARVGDGGIVEIVGDLTMRGTTREIALAVVEITGEQKDHNGVVRRGASATAKIKRSEFGIIYNKILEAGGVAISDDVALTLDVSMTKNAAT